MLWIFPNASSVTKPCCSFFISGGIISYTFNTEGSKLHTNVQPITNPYYTDDLDPDDNFGKLMQYRQYKPAKCGLGSRRTGAVGTIFIKTAKRSRLY